MGCYGWALRIKKLVLIGIKDKEDGMLQTGIKDKEDGMLLTGIKDNED